MNAEPLSPAAVLEITKPSASLGMVRPLIAGAATGDVQGQREIRDAYLSLAEDGTLPVATLVSSAECAVMMARLAASHGELNDVTVLADALWRSAILFEQARIPGISQARMIEALGLYKRLMAAGLEGVEEDYQTIIAALPLEIVARIEEEERRVCLEGQGGSCIESVRVH